MRRSRSLWGLLLATLLLAGLLGLAYSLAGFEAVKDGLDNLAPDGDFERLTRATYAATRGWGLAGGSLGLLIAASLLFARQLSQVWVEAAQRGLDEYRRKLGEDARIYLTHLWAARPRGGELIALLAMMLFGAAVRALLLDRPIQHDEAYTFIAFVSRGLRYVVGDYHLPNNHVFHTLQVFLSYKVFGEAPWALRLPAFLAGVALIPAAYAAGRLAFNRWAGLAAAGLVATNMHLAHYASEARGYSLVALLGVLIWLLAMQLLRQPNRFAWLLLTLFAALGFWTMPTMLYPYGGVLLWMAASWLLQDRGQHYATFDFWRDLISSGFITGLLTVLLYSPVFKNWGFAAVFNNGIVASMVDEDVGEFFENLGARWGDAWTAWNEGLWLPLTVVSVMLFLLAFAFQQRISRWKLPLPLVGLAFVLGLMLVQRVVGWVRVWTFGLPFYLLYVAAGAALLSNWLAARGRPLLRPLLLGGLVLGSAVSVGTWVLRPGDSAAELRGAPGEVERASLFLSQLVTDDDVIAVISPDGPGFWYYARGHAIPAGMFEVLRTDLDQVYVVLNTESLQSVDQVILARGALRDRVDLSEAELLYSSRVIEIHRLPIIR